MNPLLFGDSADQEEKTRQLAVTCDKIDEVIFPHALNYKAASVHRYGTLYRQLYSFLPILKPFSYHEMLIELDGCDEDSSALQIEVVGVYFLVFSPLISHNDLIQELIVASSYMQSDNRP